MTSVLTEQGVISIYDKYNNIGLLTNNINKYIYGFNYHKITNDSHKKQNDIKTIKVPKETKQSNMVRTKTKNHFETDILFWYCYKKITNDTTQGHNFQKQSSFRYSIVEILNSIKHKESYKSHKLFDKVKYDFDIIATEIKKYNLNIELLIANISSIEPFNIQSFIFICILFGLDVCLINKKSVLPLCELYTAQHNTKEYNIDCFEIDELYIDENKNVLYKNIVNKTETKQNILSKYYIVKSLIKKIKSISSYKVSDLREIMNVLNIDDIDIQSHYQISKIKKQDIYNYISYIL